VAFVPRRDREGNDIVARLTDELAPGRNRLVVLWGAGGVGKTAIAIEAARGLSEAFNQRVVWASAEAREDFNLSLLLDSIATQLGYPDLRKLALETKKEQIREVLTESPALVVLDNFETIAPAEADLCVAWLAQSAPCSALITTRQMIESARNIPLEQMFSDEAQNLLQRLIMEVHNPSAFASLNRERVIRTAESNPLVLQWIVGQIDLAQDPDEVLDDLARGEGPAAKRVFDRSFNLPQLNAGGRPVLLALSLFVPSATRTALSEVAGMSKDKDKKRFKDAVKTLSALWLIRATEEQRLAVGGLTRELTKARLFNDPRSKIFRQRFVSRFLNYAETHQKPTPANFNALEAEKDNLQAAVDVACELHDLNAALRLSFLLASPVTGLLSVRGYWDEAVKLLEQALRITPLTHDEAQVAGFSHNLAVMYQNRGQLKEARRLYRESMEISKKFGDQRGVAASLNQMATLALDTGEVGDARLLYRESLEIKQRLGDQRGIAITLHQMATLALDTGEVGDARLLIQESLKIKQRLGDQRGIAISLRTLGAVAQEQGDFSEAQRLYTESLEIDKKLQNQSGIAFSLHQMGTLRLAEKDFETAERLLSESLEILKKLGHKMTVAECLASIGKLRMEQERMSEALSLFNEALGVAEDISAKKRIGSVKHSLGLLALKRGDKNEAARLFQEALNIFEQLGSAEREMARRSLEDLS
jgi:tetratricopeptide (TPR) repeat protein